MKFNPAVAFRSSALLAVVAAGCGPSGKTQSAPPPIPEVSIVTAHKVSVPLTTELPGRTVPVLVAQVRSRVDGIVLRREFKEGSDVKANQRLFKIDPPPYRAALDSANATLGRAQASVNAAKALTERYRVLLGGNGVSKQEYDNAVAAHGQAEADVAAGRAAVQIAQINLGYTDVVAPITGRIGPAAVTPGAYVQATGTLMATIQQLDPMYVDLTQSSLQGLQMRHEVARGEIKLNGRAQTKVALFLEDGSKYPHTGSLEFTDVTVDPATGSVTVRAVFPNPQAELLPGMFVRGVFEEGVNSSVTLIPQPGVTHNSSGKATVLVVGTDNKVAPRIIDAARTAGSDWVVESGLDEGDRVVIEGGQTLRPGAIVKTVPFVPKLPGANPASAPAAAASQVRPGTVASQPK
jgi:membrane fusion protein (multidrug efflux system)